MGRLILLLPFLVFVSAGTLVGCGQKGPLYLPKHTQQAEPAKDEATAEKESATKEKNTGY